MFMIKIGWEELCGNVHTALIRTPSRIQIGACINLSVSVSVTVSGSRIAEIITIMMSFMT